MGFAAGEDVRFRQLMVAVGNDTPDEVAPHLVRFMAEAGAGGDIPADFILSQGAVRFNLEGIGQVEIDGIRKDSVRRAQEPYQTHAGVQIPGHAWVVSASRG